MNLTIHQMNSLFDQLGLESTEDAIIDFVKSHQLSAGMPMEDALFWQPSQIQFLREAREQDADWVELVDELDALLHKSSMER